MTSLATRCISTRLCFVAPRSIRCLGASAASGPTTPHRYDVPFSRRIRYVDAMFVLIVVSKGDTNARL